MSEINTLLDNEIAAVLEELKPVDSSSDNYTKSVDNLVKLYKLRLDNLRVEKEYEEKEKLREQNDAQNEAKLGGEGYYKDQELEIKRKQLDEQKIDRLVKVGVDLISIISTWTLFRTSFKEGLIFEETGSVRSPWVRGLINKIIPGKK